MNQDHRVNLKRDKLIMTKSRISSLKQDHYQPKLRINITLSKQQPKLQGKGRGKPDK